MRTRYAILLSLGATALLIAVLFIPLPMQHVHRSKPAQSVMMATISLVDSLEIQKPIEPSPLAEKEENQRQAEEPVAPLASVHTNVSEEEIPIEQEKDGFPLQQEEVQTVSEETTQSSPVLLDGYYTVESVANGPVFDKAALASRMVYPPLAKRQHKEGLVIVRLFISSSGLVERIVVEEDPGYGFAEAVAAAFTSFKVTPAVYQGEPVAVTLRYPIRFSLQ